ncbi:MAG TPA: fibronectin type III domain-containing protein [Terracidiphilus sp.]|nr:fibronectin type III domain-containing protein [Terracidiphilus sp.]
MKKAYVTSLLLLVLLIGCGGSSKKIAGTPAGLAASAGDSKVSLTWTAVTGATSYNVYYSSTSGVTTANGTKVSTSQPSTTITGLVNGTTYYFIVTALNSAGESGAAAAVSAKPLPVVSSAPIGLNAVSGDGQVTLTWTAVSGATSYNVYYSTATGVTPANGTKASGITAATTTITGLTNGTAYYFIVTAVNLGGESAASAEANAKPVSAGGISLTPGTPGSKTLAFGATDSLTFQFAANAVSVPANVDISSVSQSNLPLPLSRSTRAHAAAMPQVSASDTFILAFQLAINPTSITTFNVPVGISGTVDPAVSSTGVTLNLAVLSGSGSNQTWVDVSTFVVSANGVLNQNLASINLQGLLQPGTYLLYQPAAGTSTSVSNLGVALIADDGEIMGDTSNGLQIVHFYDNNGNLLSTPTISYLDYANQGDLDGQAMTPDGSQGIMVDGSNLLSFFSGVQTGVPLASTTTVDISNYGGDGDSVGIMPNGDEAVVSGDSSSELLVVSGIVSGKPVAAETIAVPDYRDGVVVSQDGKVLLARGGSGMTVYSIADITPVAGSLGGMVAHSYTQVTDMAAMGTNGFTEDGRDGMAISPADSSTAVVALTEADTVQLVTGLPANPVAGPSVALQIGTEPLSVSISPDGKFAVVGASVYDATLNRDIGELFLFSGVDTGTLTQVGTAYQPTYNLGLASVTLGVVRTLGITLDGKYVVAGDYDNRALVVIPFTASGFATAPAAVLGGVAIPYNDQLLIH